MTTDVNQSRWSQAAKEIVSGGAFRAFLSVILGFIVGAVFMVFSNEAFLQAITYFTARPTDALSAAGKKDVAAARVNMEELYRLFSDG